MYRGWKVSSFMRVMEEKYWKKRRIWYIRVLHKYWEEAEKKIDRKQEEGDISNFSLDMFIQWLFYSKFGMKNMETKQIIFVGYWFFHVMGLCWGRELMSNQWMVLFSSSVNKTLYFRSPGERNGVDKNK